MIEDAPVKILDIFQYFIKYYCKNDNLVLRNLNKNCFFIIIFEICDISDKQMVKFYSLCIYVFNIKNFDTIDIYGKTYL